MYDVAPDVELNQLADAFLKFEILDQSPGAARFQDKLLKDSGLDQESADTILELKSAITEYQKREGNASAL